MWSGIGEPRNYWDFSKTWESTHKQEGVSTFSLILLTAFSYTEAEKTFSFTLSLAEKLHDKEESQEKYVHYQLLSVHFKCHF